MKIRFLNKLLQCICGQYALGHAKSYYRARPALYSIAFSCLFSSVIFTDRLYGDESASESEWADLDLRPVSYVIWLNDFFSGEEIKVVGLTELTADPDLDGQDNYFEYLANIDPTDRMLFFALNVVITADSKILEFGPVSNNSTYEVQYKANTEPWVSLASDLYSQNGENIQIDITTFSENSLFRIVISNGDVDEIITLSDN